jgi:hypothetical protein
LLNNLALVATVDELMAPSTRLDSSVASTADARRLLYDLLTKALAPEDAREMETAE